MDNLTSFNATLKDFYPRPGERMKQYVADTLREHKWENETSPRVDVERHDDNTGIECRNVGRVPWTWLDHDACYDCGDRYEALRDGPLVQAWLAEKAKRPPICEDREKLSDEIAPDPSLAEHPVLAMVRK